MGQGLLDELSANQRTQSDGANALTAGALARALSSYKQAVSLKHTSEEALLGLAFCAYYEGRYGMLWLTCTHAFTRPRRCHTLRVCYH